MSAHSLSFFSAWRLPGVSNVAPELVEDPVADLLGRRVGALDHAPQVERAVLLLVAERDHRLARRAASPCAASPARRRSRRTSSATPGRRPAFAASPCWRTRRSTGRSGRRRRACPRRTSCRRGDHLNCCSVSRREGLLPAVGLRVLVERQDQARPSRARRRPGSPGCRRTTSGGLLLASGELDLLDPAREVAEGDLDRDVRVLLLELLRSAALIASRGPPPVSDDDDAQRDRPEAVEAARS